MKRKTLVSVHIIATTVAVITTAVFFFSSLIAEINGNKTVIMSVKKGILMALPLMLVVMPVLGISGNKLAGKSRSPAILIKQKRMRFIFINGMGLISLAIYLYSRSQYGTLDASFLIAQLAEFLLGITNLVLIGLNMKDGFRLSGRFKKQRSREASTYTS